MEDLIGKTVRIISEGEEGAKYIVLKTLDNDKVLIVDNPTDPTILDRIPMSLIEVVDE